MSSRLLFRTNGRPLHKVQRRWYVDADTLGIPKVEAAGLAIITRDRHIESRTNEKRIVLECGARMFAIVTERKLHNWDMLEIVVHQWPKMETAAEEPGPYIFAMTRTTMHKIDLTN